MNANILKEPKPVVYKGFFSAKQERVMIAVVSWHLLVGKELNIFVG